MQKVGLDPHEEGRLSEQEMCLWRRLSQLEMHQKMGEEEGEGEMMKRMNAGEGRRQMVDGTW